MSRILAVSELIPASDNLIGLGNTSYRFSTIYSRSLNVQPLVDNIPSIIAKNWISSPLGNGLDSIAITNDANKTLSNNGSMLELNGGNLNIYGYGLNSGVGKFSQNSIDLYSSLANTYGRLNLSGTSTYLTFNNTVGGLSGGLTINSTNLILSSLGNKSLTIDNTSATFNTTVSGSNGVASSDFVTKQQLDTKQATLISATNIKTINGNNILGSGDLVISGGGTTTNSLTISNSGTGAASGTTFNGSTAVTISYNSIGASPLAGSTSITTLGTISTGTWNASVIVDNKIASALTGKTYNGLTLTSNTTGFSIGGGTTSKTLTISNSFTLVGTDNNSYTFPTISGSLALSSDSISGYGITKGNFVTKGFYPLITDISATNINNIPILIADTQITDTGGFIPFIGGRTYKVGWYAPVIFGAYRHSSDWSDQGAFIGHTGTTGGHDDHPTRYFKFTSTGDILHEGSAAGSKTFWNNKNFDPTTKSDITHTHSMLTTPTYTDQWYGDPASETVGSYFGRWEAANSGVSNLIYGIKSFHDISSGNNGFILGTIPSASIPELYFSVKWSATWKNIYSMWHTGNFDPTTKLTTVVNSIDWNAPAANPQVMMLMSGATGASSVINSTGTNAIAGVYFPRQVGKFGFELGGLGDKLHFRSLGDVAGTAVWDPWREIWHSGTPLTNLSTGDTTVVNTSDTLLSGIGKLQAQITAKQSSLTLSNAGTGSASGTTFNGSTAVTISYNSIGASPLAGSASIVTVGTIVTGTWNATVIADGKIASALTGKTYNGLTLTSNATGFSIAGGTTSKTLTISNSFTLAGTDTRVYTLPSTSGTLALNTNFTTTTAGLVPAPTTSTGKFLKDDGTWAVASGGSSNLTATASVAETAWSGNTNYVTTITTVTGAALNDRVVVTLNASLFDACITAGVNLNIIAWVSAANTVKVWVRTSTYVSIPASSSYYITIIK